MGCVLEHANDEKLREVRTDIEAYKHSDFSVKKLISI